MLEAAASGRAVITTNRVGCRETVDDGVTGYLCEAKNSDSLANCIERFILLPYEQKLKMGLAGREKICMEFDRNIVINSYLDKINEVCR